MKFNIWLRLIGNEWRDFRRYPVLWIMAVMPVVLSYLVVRMAVSEENSLSSAVPMWVLFAQTMVGVMTMTLIFLEEKEKKTLDALLITPATYRTVVWSKTAFVFVLTFVIQILVLIVNGAWSDNILLFVPMFVSGLTFVLMGLLISLFSETTKNGNAGASAVMVTFFLFGAVYKSFGSFKPILDFLPSISSVNMIRDALSSQALHPKDLIVAVAWLVVLMAITEVRIRMELQK